MESAAEGSSEVSAAQGTHLEHSAGEDSSSSVESPRSASPSAQAHDESNAASLSNSVIGSADVDTAVKAEGTPGLPAVSSPYQVGDRVDAQDYMLQWYTAKIMQLDLETSKVLVHFERWSK
jgi:hypothetical protein